MTISVKDVTDVYGGLNDIGDAPFTPVGDRRLSTPAKTLQRLQEELFTPNTLAARNLYRGLVLATLPSRFPRRASKSAYFESLDVLNGTDEQYIDPQMAWYYYKVYVPEIDPRCIELNDLVAEGKKKLLQQILSLDDTFMSIDLITQGMNKKIAAGTIVTIRFEDPRRAFNPEIVHIGPVIFNYDITYIQGEETFPYNSNITLQGQPAPASPGAPPPQPTATPPASTPATTGSTTAPSSAPDDVSGIPEHYPPNEQKTKDLFTLAIEKAHAIGTMNGERHYKTAAGTWGGRPKGYDMRRKKTMNVLQYTNHDHEKDKVLDLTKIPLEWATNAQLHRVLGKESGGWVGIPNYTYNYSVGTGDPRRSLQLGKGAPVERKREKWPICWEQARNFKSGHKQKVKSDGTVVNQYSSATGLGQCLSRNAAIFYPDGVNGISDALNEAVGMICYIYDRYGDPDTLGTAYGKKCTFVNSRTGLTETKWFKEGY